MCKLKRTLYGLKLSPRAWYQQCNLFFVNEGFPRSQLDHSLYIKLLGEYLLVTLLYVGSLTILVSNITTLKRLKLELGKEFEINGLGKL